MDSRIRAIWANALTLQERLDSLPFLHAEDEPHKIVQQRLQSWVAALGGQDLQQHLQRLGIAPEHLPRILGPITIDPSAVIPAWVAELERFIGHTPDQEQIPHAVSEDPQQLFDGVFLPYLRHVTQSRLSDFLSGCLPDANIDIDDLARQMAVCLCPCIDAVLLAHARIMKIAGKSSSRYIEWMRNDGALSFFSQYPVAARLLFTKISQFADATKDCLERLVNDAESIRTTLRNGMPLAALTSLQPGLSDFHNGGTSVMMLGFADGQRLVYKPKNLAAEVAYGRLVDWLAASMPDLPRLLAPAALDCGAYGWAGYVEEAPAAQQSTAEYWHAYGQLIALHFLLGSSDCIASNLIHGKTPVIIDHEMVMTGLFFASADEKAFYLTRSGVQTIGPFPLLRSGLVPRYRYADQRLECQSPVSPEAAHTFANEIVAGFNSAVTRISGVREEFCNYVEQLFGDVELRFLFRDTQFYQRFLGTMSLPSRMKSGVERSLHAQQLFRVCEHAHAADPKFSIVSTEIAALEQNDVPIIHCRSRSRRLDVKSGAAQIHDALELSPLQRSSAIMRDALFEDNALLAQQLRSALQSHGASAAGVPEQALEHCAARIKDVLVAKISSTLFRSSARVDDFNFYGGFLGHAVFLAAANLAQPDPVLRKIVAEGYPDRYADLFKQHSEELPPYVGLDLYALALLARLTGSAVPVRRALECVHVMKNAGFRLPRPDLIGGMAGLCIGLLSIYELNRDPEVLEFAIETGRRMQERMHYGAIGASDVEGSLDTGMAHGAAGIALAFSRLFKTTALDIFRHGADAALAFEASMKTEKNWWDRIDRRTGIPADGERSSWCHGAPGIGLARIGMLATHARTQLAGDIDHAMAFTADTLHWEPDHACCGILGKSEFLLAAGEALQRQEWLAQARQIAESAASAYLAGGQFDLGSSRSASGFFQGLSGIGYQFLRLARPGMLPSVLLFN